MRSNSLILRYREYSQGEPIRGTCFSSRYLKITHFFHPRPAEPLWAHRRIPVRPLDEKPVQVCKPQNKHVNYFGGLPVRFHVETVSFQTVIGYDGSERPRGVRVRQAGAGKELFEFAIVVEDDFLLVDGGWQTDAREVWVLGEFRIHFSEAVLECMVYWKVFRQGRNPSESESRGFFLFSKIDLLWRRHGGLPDAVNDRIMYDSYDGNV